VGTKAAPSLQIPACQETQAFRAICQVLENDPILSPATQTFIKWTDVDLDVWDPAWSLCPWLKVSPFPTESNWIMEAAHDMPMTVRIQAATRGTNIDNLMNYWSLVRNAIFRQDGNANADAVRTILMNAGINRPTINLNAYGHSVDDEGLRILIADGTIKFGMFINT
jgi:hypothetical protein